MRKKNNERKDNKPSSYNNNNKEVDQIINALIKENEILTKAAKDNAYTPLKMLNDLMTVLYTQRNQLNSLEQENDALEQSLSQLNSTIGSSEEKNNKTRTVFKPNGYVSFSNVKPHFNQLENTGKKLLASTNSFHKKTLKPINQSQSQLIKNNIK